MKVSPKMVLHRKSPFQLLELMVAVFILLVCVTPAMRIYTTIYKSQQAIVRENQRDHFVHLWHAKLTEQLYQQKISLEDAMQGQAIALQDSTLSSMLEKIAYQVETKFSILDYKPKKEAAPTDYLGKIEIKMIDKLAAHPEVFYDYYLYIDAQKEQQQEESLSSAGPDNETASHEVSSSDFDDEDSEEESSEEDEDEFEDEESEDQS